GLPSHFVERTKSCVWSSPSYEEIGWPIIVAYSAMPSISHHDRAAPSRLPASDVTWVSSWVSRVSSPRCWTTSVRTTTSVTVSPPGTPHAAALAGCWCPYHFDHSAGLARKIPYRFGPAAHLATVSATAAALSAAAIALSSRHSFVLVAATIARLPRFTTSW